MYRKSVEHLYDLTRVRVPHPSNLTMRLQRLEKPEPWPADLQALLTPPEGSMRLYPNIQPLKDKVAGFFDVPTNHVVFGSGIEDFFRGLFLLTCEPGDKAAVTWPTCAMLDVIAEMFKVDLVRLKHGPREQPAMEDFIWKLPPGLKLLILPNPGQPVELCFTYGELRYLANFCEHQGITLAIDEAYWGFGAPTAIELTKDFDNVLVLRTFSKLFGSAGIRLGCAIGQPAAVKPLEAIRFSNEVTGPTVHAAHVMLDHYDSHVKPWAEAVKTGRDWLRGQLRQDGFYARGQWANHVLVDFNSYEAMIQMADALAAQGIYVKSRFPKPLDTCLLITCGSLPTMERFYSAWQSVGMVANV